MKTLGELGAELERKNGDVSELQLPKLHESHFGLIPGGGDAWKNPNPVVAMIGEVDTLESIWIVPGDLRLVNLSPWLRLRRLRRVQINNAHLSTANFEVIATLPSLESLSLSGSTFEGESLEPLTRCKQLRSVELFGYSGVLRVVTDDWKEADSEAPREERITQAFPYDKAMPIIRRIKSIEELSFILGNIDSKKLEGLRGMESLKRLDLSGTDVDDTVIDVLLSFPKLEHVNLTGTGVTEDGVARLRRESRNKSLEIDEI